jgi:hypothetical protein
MIDWLRHTLHLVPDTVERDRTDALVSRIDRAVEGKRREDAALAEEIVRHHPQTDLARALLRARDGGHAA